MRTYYQMFVICQVMNTARIFSMQVVGCTILVWMRYYSRHQSLRHRRAVIAVAHASPMAIARRPVGSGATKSPMGSPVHTPTMRQRANRVEERSISTGPMEGK